MPPSSQSGEFYRDARPSNAFDCSLRLMTIRNNLLAAARQLDDLNRTMLDEAFGKGVGSG